MNKKLFYEQPLTRVLHVHTESLMQAFSPNGSYGDEKEEIWDNEDA